MAKAIDRRLNSSAAERALVRPVHDGRIEIGAYGDRTAADRVVYASVNQ